MAEDKMDKDLERQYRKNLMVVASIVLIYSIAGGHMGADLSMFGAKLRFSRPDWLEYAMVAVMCFFWWRHWQLTRHQWGEIIESARLSVEISERFFNQIKTDACKKINADVNEYKMLSENGDIRLIRSDARFTNDGYLLRLRRLGFLKAVISSCGFNEFNLNYGPDRLYWHCVRLFVLQLIKESFVLVKFGDSILPSIVSVAALLSWFINKFVLAISWQSEWCADLFNRL